MRPICRNTQNQQAYEYLGGNKFKNIITGKEGEVPDDKAQEILKFNIEATEIINEYPVVESLIKSLELKFDNNKNKNNE